LTSKRRAQQQQADEGNAAQHAASPAARRCHRRAEGSAPQAEKRAAASYAPSLSPASHPKTPRSCSQRQQLPRATTRHGALAARSHQTECERDRSPHLAALVRNPCSTRLQASSKPLAHSKGAHGTRQVSMPAGVLALPTAMCSGRACARTSCVPRSRRDQRAWGTPSSEPDGPLRVCDFLSCRALAGQRVRGAAAATGLSTSFRSRSRPSLHHSA
jgi:hypothetical protein